MEIEKFASDFGIKLTPHRRIIISVLSTAKDHPDVEEIHHRAARKYPKIGLATIYRNLSLLEHCGAIQKLEIGGRKARYELNHSKEDDHHHLIDVATGAIVEFSFMREKIRELTQEIGQMLGYEILNYKFELYGMPQEKTQEKRTEGTHLPKSNHLKDKNA